MSVAQTRGHDTTQQVLHKEGVFLFCHSFYIHKKLHDYFYVHKYYSGSRQLLMITMNDGIIVFALPTTTCTIRVCDVTRHYSFFGCTYCQCKNNYVM